LQPASGSTNAPIDIANTRFLRMVGFLKIPSIQCGKRANVQVVAMNFV
jgi:hypothetical protein